MTDQSSNSKSRLFLNVNMSYSLQGSKIWSSYEVSDKGLLDMTERHITFNGRSSVIHIRDIRNVRMLRAGFRWKDYIVINLLLVFVFFVASVISFCLGVSDALNFLGYVAGVVISGMIVYSTFAVLFYVFDMWIEVDYIDEKGFKKMTHFSQWGQFGVFSNKTRFLLDKVVS
jgi:hypothetical protein